MGALGRRGVSPLVAEVMMLAIIVAVLAAVATTLVARKGTTVILAKLDVEVYENQSDFRVVRLMVKHREGDAIPTPGDTLLVWGHEEGEDSKDNRAYSWWFPDPSRLRIADNAICFIRHDQADVREGDKFSVRIINRETNEIILRRTVAVRAPS